MPFEMVPICPLCVRVEVAAVLAVTVNGVAGAFVSVEPFADQVHILTACDVIIPGSAPASLNGGRCPQMVTHADGKLVNFSNPAHAGEQLVAYATGLGQTDPPQQTGKPAPTFGRMRSQQCRCLQPAEAGNRYMLALHPASSDFIKSTLSYLPRQRNYLLASTQLSRSVTSSNLI